MAGSEFSFYTFQGIKPRGSDKLHLTSHRFDEPVAMKAAGESQAILAVHGEKSRERAFTMVGGRWTYLRESLAGALDEAGFLVEEPRPGLRGENPGISVIGGGPGPVDNWRSAKAFAPCFAVRPRNSRDS